MKRNYLKKYPEEISNNETNLFFKKVKLINLIVYSRSLFVI